MLALVIIIILGPTLLRVSRLDLTLWTSAEALVVGTYSNRWAFIAGSVVRRVESYAFLFYYLWWVMLFLVLDIKILVLLWTITFLTITNVFL